MSSKFLVSNEREPKRCETPRDLDRMRHFEALLLQSFAEMRARAAKA